MADEPPSEMSDLGGLLGMAMEMSQQMAAAQEQAAAEVVEGQAGGGAVRIEVTGGFEFRSVTISPEALDPDDVEMLQDLVLAALHDASAKVQELQSTGNPLAAMGGLGGMDLSAVGGIGGLDLGTLTGALGALDVDAAPDAAAIPPADDDGPTGSDRPGAAPRP
jgi:nucleoid-associated protein EbfC